MAGFLRFWLPPLLYALLIFILSGMSMPPVPANLDSNILHYPEYAALSFLLVRAFHGGGGGKVPVWKMAAAFLCSAVFGLSDEIHQAFVPQRVPDASDFIHDIVGAAIGIAIFVFVNYLASLKKKGLRG